MSSHRRWGVHVIFEISEKAEVYLLKNVVDYLTDLQKKVTSPIKKGTLSLIGNIRLTRRDGGYISNNLCDSIVSELQTGDLIFQKRESYLSNIGVPGFWSHVAIYLGDEKDLKNFFCDDELIKHKKSF